MTVRRVALVTESFRSGADGQTTVRNVTDQLIAAGVDVQLIAPWPGPATYHGTPVTRILPLDQPGTRIRQALEAFAPDVVHVISPGHLGRKVLKEARRMAVPTAVAQLPPVHEELAERWKAKVADRADRVLVSTRWMVERLASQGVEAHLWTPGIDLTAFSPARRSPAMREHWAGADRPVLVGYVGSLHKRHGVHKLAELAAVPGIRVVVIGDGPQRSWLRMHLPRAKLTGALSPTDLAVALASLDLVVHPGRRETCCHVLREAAASGVPVVAPRAGGAPDVVRHLETGVLYDPDDPRALAEAVAALAADQQRALLGARAREVAAGRSWSDAVEELVLHHYPLATERLRAAQTAA